ncbi:RNA polymerase sigma factor [Egicoccus halophilus]|uniref:RNA polymerase sigma-70 factor, ECF subfamily n=1 Tax=Egicoccus halophilus TaxID=1670830 RepID=A0A8J3A8J8_9ACTN|nr:sigma-70 family RNA polymerase sigma factor [Egicoccus halophilus]GGI06957.1 hypothetical protein GCM10011354_21690 [Egicoccus halophilus]
MTSTSTTATSTLPAPGIPAPATDAAPGPPPDALDWYAHNWDRARRFAAARLRDTTEAEDVASDVLLRVWARWERIGRPDDPDAYLFRALRNELVTRYRRRDLERRTMDRRPTPSVIDAGPEEHVAHRDEVDRLLEQLAPADRRTVVAHYLEDRSCDDIAQELSLATASVRSRLHRSRRQLAASAVTRQP